MQTRSKKLASLPTYLFAELDKKKRAVISKGTDVIDLGVGDPDLSPPKKMIKALAKALEVPEYHQYPAYNGADFFRYDVADWLAAEHGVKLDPKTELLTLIGSKEGLAHLPQAILNPGDHVFVTDPCYPVHFQAMLLAGAVPETLPLYESNAFLPDLSSVPAKKWGETKLLVLNYPNNPTSAVATEEFFKDAVRLAEKHGFVICQDAAYIDVNIEGKKQPALLSIKGAKDVAIEFFTFSKMFNICGWRVGVAAGNSELVASLAKYKTAVDSGQFTAVQSAISVGLKGSLGSLKETCKIYKERKDILCTGLKAMGLKYFQSGSTFYVWTKVPSKYSSAEFAGLLLEKLGIAATPGVGFGKLGDDYIRFSLTSPTKRIKEAMVRMKNSDIL